MCNLDLELADVWIETQPTARKTRKCPVCQNKIEPGHTYLRVNVVHDSSASSHFCCAVCAVIYKDFSVRHGGAPPPDELADMLHECVVDVGQGGAFGAAYFDSIADRLRAIPYYRKHDAYWRKMLAIIKWRQRQA